MGDKTDKTPWVPQRVTEADVEIGRVLAAARERAGMQVREAAEASGIDKSVVTRIELGQRPCRVAELAALADAFGIDRAALFHAATADI
ncbi:helix-turn-helix domain-containing protein [Mycobacterium avium]|uniref:helix-turn-helix domain-containing protein n=1 Tax=Mycobacterium avium TaxID=1764 RepID=UPI0007A05EA5|nr:helix-turn-helix transcriptional regulator [Mycobacterium avium]